MQPDIPQIEILMLGDSLSKQGGIVTLQKLMLKHAPAEIRIRQIATVVGGAAIAKVVVFAIALCKFVFYLSTTKVDLVHIHVAERGSAYRKSILTAIAKLFRKPVILHSHSPEFREFYQGLPQLVQRGLLWAFSQCDRFIALSNSWRDFYVELGLKPEQVIVLANPIELPTQVAQHHASSQINAIFLGRIGQRKGSFDLIQAFSLLPDEDKSCSRLTLAGDGEVEQARDLVSSLNLQNYVNVRDWLNSEQKDTLLSQADIFVLPSYNEGLPIALLEAMGWGLPVITTPVGGIPDLVISSKNGLLVDAGDVQQLSQALQSLIRNESLRLSLGSAARESVTPLDVKIYFSCLLDIYHSVLAAKRHGFLNVVN